MANTREVTQCGTCHSKELVTVLDMGRQPLAEAMGSTRTYPLKLVKCLSCSLVQLSYIVPPEEVFPEDHPFSTGNSMGNRKHFHELALKVRDMVSPGELVVDIGCNDGTFLADLAMTAPGLNLLGVEPTGQAARAEAKGIPIVRDFFTSRIARGIVRKHGLATVVTASNVLAHVPDPKDFLAGVGWMLVPATGTFITENHDWANIERGLQVDTIYHEHLRYYSVGSLAFQLARSEFTVTRVEPTEQHGGSFRTYASSQPTLPLASRAETVRRDIYDLVRNAAGKGRIFGIGAATRATPLIHYAGIAKFIECICEVSTSDKIGKTMPGTTIPVVEESVLFDKQPEYALMLSWHLAPFIMRALVNGGFNGDFIIPLPSPHIVEDIRG